MKIIYFSSVSNNTHRFVEKSGLPSERIPLYPSEGSLSVSEPYILVVPTYGGGNEKANVPKQVVKFLNDEVNRSYLRGVIGTGNANFYDTYCRAADIISYKCNVPVLARVEILGTNEDVEKMRDLCLRQTTII